MALRINKELRQMLDAARRGEVVKFGDSVIPCIGSGGLVKESAEGRTRLFKLSDKSVDRDNDTIDPNGWDLNDFRRNGAVLWAHDSWSPPIATPGPVGVDGADESAALYGQASFLTEEEYAFSALLLRLIDAGALKNTSVGFRAIEWVYDEERRGINFLRQKLVEWSVVPIGSNVNAMIQLAGETDLTPMLDWAQRWLDNDEVIGKAVADEDEVAAICKALAPLARTVDPGLPPPAVPEKDSEVEAGAEVEEVEEVITPVAVEAAPQVVLDAKTIDQLIEQAAVLPDVKKSAAVVEALKGIREVIDPEVFTMTREELRDFAAETIRTVREEEGGVTQEDVLRIAHEEVSRVQEEVLRRTGRLPR